MEIELREVGLVPTTKICQACLLPWLTTMEIELQESWGDADKFDTRLSRYTSLKDIIPSSASPLEVISELYCESSITIKNHLVKIAASAYVQSSAITAVNRSNTNCFSRLWQVMKDRAVARLGWNNYIRGFSCCVAGKISWFFTSVARRVRVHGRR